MRGRKRRSYLLLVVTAVLMGCAPEPAVEANIGAGLRVNTVLGGAADGFAVAAAPRTFVFPEDHGSHPAYRSEWWYITAVLTDASGREYGMQFTLFRQALTPEPTGVGPWHSGQAYLGHLAVTDVASGRHRHAQRFARGHPDLAGVEAVPFHAWIEDWQLRKTAADPFTLALAATGTDFSVALTFRQTQPVALQGDDGLSHKGPGQASYYYSMPRLESSGELHLAGRTVPVQGLAWLDREWSTSVLGDHLSGWNWFALQLDDGRSVMAFSLTRKDGQRDPFDHGLHISAGGDQRRTLRVDDYRLTPLRYWEDGEGRQWPVAWTLSFADSGAAPGGQTWTVEALLDDQLMDLGFVYWEGIVAVRDAAGARIGRGYMELTGY